MVDLVLDIIGWFLMICGAFLVVAAAIGVVRFPDFYTRMHAAGVTDTFGAELFILGMMTQTDDILIIVKLVFIAFFMFFTGPVATHSIAHAAHVAGLKPWDGKGDGKEDDASNAGKGEE